jgi:O-acetyl-ADP-ribose deacetylase
MTGSGGTQFRTVIHAVAVDGLYQTSIEVVSQVVRKSLNEASNRHAKKVALVALATGFGPLIMSDFGCSLRALKSEQFPPIEQVVVVVTSDDDVAEIDSGFNAE